MSTIENTKGRIQRSKFIGPLEEGVTKKPLAYPSTPNPEPVAEMNIVPVKPAPTIEIPQKETSIIGKAWTKAKSALDALITPTRTWEEQTSPYRKEEDKPTKVLPGPRQTTANLIKQDKDYEVSTKEGVAAQKQQIEKEKGQDVMADYAIQKQVGYGAPKKSYTLPAIKQRTEEAILYQGRLRDAAVNETEEGDFDAAYNKAKAHESLIYGQAKAAAFIPRFTYGAIARDAAMWAKEDLGDNSVYKPTGTFEELMYGEEDVERLMTSEDLYGIIARNTNKYVALSAMIIIDDLAIPLTGGLIAKVGKEGLESVMEKFFKSQIKDGKMTKAEASVIRKEMRANAKISDDFVKATQEVEGNLIRLEANAVKAESKLKAIPSKTAQKELTIIEEQIVKEKEAIASIEAKKASYEGPESLIAAYDEKLLASKTIEEVNVIIKEQAEKTSALLKAGEKDVAEAFDKEFLQKADEFKQVLDTDPKLLQEDIIRIKKELGEEAEKNPFYNKLKEIVEDKKVAYKETKAANAADVKKQEKVIKKTSKTAPEKTPDQTKFKENKVEKTVGEKEAESRRYAPRSRRSFGTEEMAAKYKKFIPDGKSASDRVIPGVTFHELIEGDKKSLIHYAEKVGIKVEKGDTKDIIIGKLVKYSEAKSKKKVISPKDMTRDELDKAITKKIEDHRKTSGYMARKEGTGKKGNARKAFMTKQAKDGKELAEKELKELDKDFVALIEVRDAKQKIYNKEKDDLFDSLDFGIERKTTKPKPKPKKDKYLYDPNAKINIRLDPNATDSLRNQKGSARVPTKEDLNGLAAKLKERQLSITQKTQNEIVRWEHLLKSGEVVVREGGDDVVSTYKRYFGRVATRQKEIADESIKLGSDISSAAKELGADVKKFRKELNDYMVAKHSIERNATQKIEKTAGFTTKEAQERVAQIEKQGYGKKVQEISQKIIDLNKRTLDTLLEGNLMSRAEYDLLKKQWDNYVPFNRIMKEDGNVFNGLAGSKGFSNKSTGIFKARGSDLEVEDILSNSISNALQATARVEKNKIGLAVLDFAKDNKDVMKDMFEFPKKKGIGLTFDGESIITKPVRDEPNVMFAFNKGKLEAVRIKDDNLAQVLNGTFSSHGTFPGIGVIRGFTRYKSAMATKYNLPFVLSNAARDAQDLITYLSTIDGITKKEIAKVPTDILKAELAITGSFVGKGETRLGKLYKQMQADGGTTGGMSFAGRDDVKINIDKIIGQSKSSPKRAFKKMLDVVENTNAVFEDASRLVAYDKALNAGLTRKEAAVIAKEATINFNTKGTYGPAINSLYMFANASIQGTVKNLKVMNPLKHPKTFATTNTILGGAVMAVGAHNDKINPNWREEVDEWDRTKNIVWLLDTQDGVKEIKMPISYGLTPFKAVWDLIDDSRAGKFKGGDKAAKTILTSILESYNPVGGTDPLSAIMPTILDLPVAVGRNLKWTGSNIHPDYKSALPKSEQVYSSEYKSTRDKAIVKFFQDMKDGGGADINPENVIYVLNDLLGGAGGFVSDVANVAATAIKKDEDVKLKDVPFVKRFYKEKTQEQIDMTTSRNEKDDFKEELNNFKSGSDEQKEFMQDKLAGMDTDKERQSFLYSFTADGFDGKGISVSSDIIAIKDKFNAVQKELNNGDKKAAQKIVNDLSDDDYDKYRKAVSSWKASNSRTFRGLMDGDDTAKAKAYLLTLRPAESQRILDNMTDEDYKKYKDSTADGS